MSKTFLELAVQLRGAGIDGRLIKAMCRLYIPEMRKEVLDAVIDAHMVSGLAWMDAPAIEQIDDLLDMLRRKRPEIKSLLTEAERLNALLEDVDNPFLSNEIDEINGAKLMSMVDLERKRLTRLEANKPSRYRVQLMLSARIAVAVAPDNIQDRMKVFNACINRFQHLIAPGLVAPGATKRNELFKLAKENNEEDPSGTSMLVEAYRDRDHDFWKPVKKEEE